MAQVKPIQDGSHTLIPHLVVKGAAQAIDFYEKAFGAVEVIRMFMPDGKTLMHGQLKIGDSQLMLAEESPQMCSKGPTTLGGTPVIIHMNVADVDAMFSRAVAAGATAKMPPTDMFWGDRYSKVTDPFGHEWSIATHKEDVPPEEMKKRGEAMFAKMAQGK